jgi:hypothetical protein
VANRLQTDGGDRIGAQSALTGASGVLAGTSPWDSGHGE